MEKIYLIFFTGAAMTAQSVTTLLSGIEHRAFGQNLWLVKSNIMAKDLAAKFRSVSSGDQIVVIPVTDFSNAVLPGELKNYVVTNKAA